MRQQQRQRCRPFPRHMEEMQIDVVERHAILRKLVEARLFFPPIEALAPMSDERLHIADIRAISPGGAGRLVGEPRMREARAEIGDRFVRYMELIGPGFAAHHHPLVRSRSTQGYHAPGAATIGRCRGARCATRIEKSPAEAGLEDAITLLLLGVAVDVLRRAVGRVPARRQGDAGAGEEEDADQSSSNCYAHGCTPCWCSRCPTRSPLPWFRNLGRNRWSRELRSMSAARAIAPPLPWR
jgi:hypothetical protein